MNTMQVSCGAGENTSLQAAFSEQNLRTSESSTASCVQPKTQVNPGAATFSHGTSIGQHIPHCSQGYLTQSCGKQSHPERFVLRNQDDSASHPYGFYRSVTHTYPYRKGTAHSSQHPRVMRLDSSIRIAQKTSAVRVVRLEPAVRVAVQEAASRVAEQISAAQVAERILAARDAKQIPSSYPNFPEASSCEPQQCCYLSIHSGSSQNRSVENISKEETMTENERPKNSQRLNMGSQNQVSQIQGTVNKSLQNSSVLKTTAQSPCLFNRHSQRVGSGKIYGQNFNTGNQTLSNQSSQNHASPNLGLLENERKENHTSVQRQLIMILHADHCQLDPYPECCKILQCSTFKGVLSHMANCQVVEMCQYPYCSSSKRIYKHWNACRKATCPICQPLILKLAERRTSPSSA